MAKPMPPWLKCWGAPYLVKAILLRIVLLLHPFAEPENANPCKVATSFSGHTVLQLE